MRIEDAHLLPSLHTGPAARRLREPRTPPITAENRQLKIRSMACTPRSTNQEAQTHMELTGEEHTHTHKRTFSRIHGEVELLLDRRNHEHIFVEQ